MTTTEILSQAADLDAKADTLYLSLLAPSMREDALRAEAARLREQASAITEYGRLASQV
jgi:hypothetical protein